MITHLEGYTVTAVFGRVTGALREEVAAFWVRERAIPDALEARRRAGELVCVARNAGKEIVGVNTAYVSGFRSPEDRYFFYRMFIRPQDRALGLCNALMRAAAQTLREHRGGPGPAVRGVVLVTENPKLMRRSGKRLLEYLGWSYTGRGPRGLDIWKLDFE